MNKIAAYKEKIGTPYEKIDFNTITEMSISLSNLVDNKLYGPVYTRFVKRFTTLFESEKLREEKPVGSEEWEWPKIKEYLGKNLVRYPRGFNAILYAMAKTETVLQGYSGIANRFSLNQMAKGMNKLLGPNQQSEFSDFASAFKQIANKLVSLKVFPSNAGYSVEDENTIKFTVDKCPFKDICEKFRAEKITRYGEKDICSIGSMLSTYISLEFSPNYDYSVKEFVNPHCEVEFSKNRI